MATKCLLLAANYVVKVKTQYVTMKTFKVSINFAMLTKTNLHFVNKENAAIFGKYEV